jgi:hypothetical protein
MALDLTKLGRIAYQNGQGLHLYRTDDLKSVVIASGYFNSATDVLANGDIIMVAGDEDGTDAVFNLMVTSASGAATVTTTANRMGADLTTLGSAFGTVDGVLESLTSFDVATYATYCSLGLALIPAWKAQIDNNIADLRTKINSLIIG